jgi:Na+/glutamate symporter
MLFIIALCATIGWFIKDWIKDKSFAAVKENWKKYVGCLVGGLVYGLLSDLRFFQYIAILGVIALIANSFDEVLNFLIWLYNWLARTVSKKS